MAAGAPVGAMSCISPWKYAWRQVEEMKEVGAAITPDACSRRALLHRQDVGVVTTARYKKACCRMFPFDAKLMGWPRCGQASNALGSEILRLMRGIFLTARRREFERQRVALSFRSQSDVGPMEHRRRTSCTTCVCFQRAGLQ